MPDKDLFQRTFAPGWRRVYRMADGGKISEVELGAASVTALAKSLRESKGCPGFNELMEIVSNVEHEHKNQPLFAAGGLLNLSKPLEAIRQIELKYEEHRVTKVATRTARAFLAKGINTVSDDRTLKQDLAERICLDLVDHHFFGRGRNYFVQHRFGNFTQEREWEYHVKEQMKSSLSKLAARLVKNPNATNIRAPNRIGMRMSTQELLDEPLI
jgi:hypothetical protein